MASTGVSGAPASSQSTKEAMAWPKTAGIVPSTGSTRTRKPGSAPKSAGDSPALGSKGSGSSFTRAGSDE